MNKFLTNLFININLNYSPFLTNQLNKNIKLQNLNFNKQFSILIFLNLNNLLIFKNIFSKFLNSIININSINYINQNFTNNININNSQNFEINYCIFWKCSSSTYSAAIYIWNSKYDIKINHCGFYQLTNTLPNYQGQASCISCRFNLKNIILFTCFYNCQCEHGASYFLSEAKCIINYTLEFDIGRNNRNCYHPSQSNSNCFIENNISNSLTVYALYFAVNPNSPDYIKYSYIEKFQGNSFVQILWCSAFLNNFLFINNTASYWIYLNEAGTFSISNSYFYNCKNNLFSNSNFQIINCYFSNQINSITFFSGSTLNCQFNQLEFNLFTLNLYSQKFCWNYQFESREINIIRNNWNIILFLII